MPDRFRRQCRLLRRGALAVFVWVLLVTVTSSLPWLTLLFGLAEFGGPTALLYSIRFLPILGYLWALWAVQSALRDLAAGELFNPTVARATRHIGIGLIAGSVIDVSVVTNLSRWLFPEDAGFIYIDASAIVIGVVGAALILLSKLVDKARALQAELDEIL